MIFDVKNKFIENNADYWCESSSSSSSSCHPTSMDFLDSLVPTVPIIHHFKQVLQTTFLVHTELL